MTSYTLYGTRGSGSAAIEIALAACKQPFERVTASTWEPLSAQRELARLNPMRQIPTLQLPDGSVLLTDDGGKKIWKIGYKGAQSSAAAAQ